MNQNASKINCKKYYFTLLNKTLKSDMLPLVFMNLNKTLTLYYISLSLKKLCLRQTRKI